MFVLEPDTVKFFSEGLSVDVLSDGTESKGQEPLQLSADEILLVANAGGAKKGLEGKWQFLNNGKL